MYIEHFWFIVFLPKYNQCIVEDKPTNFPSFFAVYFDLTTKEKGNE